MITEKRIFCKVHDKGEIVVKVGIDQPNGIREVFPIEYVWTDINFNRFSFYTFENGKKATSREWVVRWVVRRGGQKKISLNAKSRYYD